MTDEISDKLQNFALTLSLAVINERIDKEVCYDSLSQISDERLRDDFLECKSVISSINKLKTILVKHIPDDGEDKIAKIIADFLPELIPPGTKGVIRGNKFNKIVMEYIKNLNLDSEKYEICFETKCEKYLTEEIPDWYILEKDSINPRVIIGMNQLDLWSGGQQINRGFKYIKSENNTSNVCKAKIVCVVCNYIQFKSSKNKAFKLFDIGFQNNTLCYLNNLGNIILDWLQE